MLRIRVIPCLLMKSGGLVKTTRFRKARYVGDPINAVRIFNEKLVDEIILLDIEASRQRRKPDLRLIEKVVSEAFMPVCYGGGVASVEDAGALLSTGVEKVAVNSAALTDPDLISRLAERFGSQSVVAAIDVKRSLARPRVFNHVRRSSIRVTPVEHARRLEGLGAGELLVTSVDRDGTMVGYDVAGLRALVKAVKVPVIGCGGAGRLEHLAEVVEAAGVSAAAAGSLFVYRGVHRAVLINYPAQDVLRGLFARVERQASGAGGPSR